MANTTKFLDETGLKKVLSNISNGNLYINGTLKWRSTETGYAIITAGRNINMGNGGIIEFSSDKRLKENIESAPASDLLQDVLKTDVKTFNFISKPDEKCVGVIAQDIQENFKNVNLDDVLVKTNDNGMLSVNETKFVYILWGAFNEYVKQTTEKIESLERKISMLENKE